MPREKEDYRAILERLNTLYPDTEMLTLTEAGRILGYTSRDAARKHLGPYMGIGKKIAKAKLARLMCGD